MNIERLPFDFHALAYDASRAHGPGIELNDRRLDDGAAPTQAARRLQVIRAHSTDLAWLSPRCDTYREQSQPEQQHKDGGKHVVSRVVTGKDVADPHKRVTALGDDAKWNDDRQVAIESAAATQKRTVNPRSKAPAIWI